MQVSELLVEGFGRLPDLVRGAVEGLDAEQLRWAPAPGANSIGWLVWHLTRVQDDHINDLLDDGSEQVWVTGAYAKRFGLDPQTHETGYGHAPEEVAAVRPESAEVLLEYFDAVHARTHAYVARLTAEDLDRIVDERWDPPVSLGVRLVSILDDDAQHVGQAAYVRGLLER
ncbi:mycothiol transferase [Dactylosporangium sp. CA-139066]|uniref:mycothiol transferase n=1 Tax=Dactylosporangium sp. CA-139066 TaxID=3239930 RepID=UPI003D8C5307